MVPSAPVDSTAQAGSLAEQVLASFPQLATANSLCVAYSGGLDSTVLLHLLSRLRRQGLLRGELRALHVHHGLQAAAERWLLHCREQCHQRGIPLMECRVHVESGAGQSPEAAARAARYKAFATELRAGEILVQAHHRDDQAETLLLRLLRGSGSFGLAGMPDSRELAQGRLLRPLLGIGRETLELYASQEKLEWIEDPSNGDDRYDRNFLRNEILPALRQRWPSASASLARTTQLLQESARLLDELAAADLAAVQAGLSNRLQVLPLQQLSEARQRNLLRHWLVSLPPALAVPYPSYQVLQRCVSQLLGPDAAGSAHLAWGQGDNARQLHRHRDLLVLLRPLPTVLKDMPWTGEQPLQLPPPLGSLHWLAPVPVPAALMVRFRHGGVRVTKADGHHQDFRDFCQQRGIPPWLRHAVPLIYHGDELLAIGDEVMQGTMLSQDANSPAVLRWQRSHLLCGW